MFYGRNLLDQLLQQSSQHEQDAKLQYIQLFYNLDVIFFGDDEFPIFL
jgi:hypothetical protein